MGEKQQLPDLPWKIYQTGARNLMATTATTAQQERPQTCAGAKRGSGAVPREEQAKLTWKRCLLAWWGVNSQHQFTGTNLHRYLKWPVSKICVRQGPSLQGEMLQETPRDQCQGCSSPLVLHVAKPGLSCCHSWCWGFSGLMVMSEALLQVSSFICKEANTDLEADSWEREELFN